MVKNALNGNTHKLINLSFFSQIQQTSPVLKSKKSSRKILQSSSPSPMKTIYKHLGISGFSWANSGCYSPSKVANKNEQLHDSKDQIMPRNKSSKTTGKKKSLKLDKSMNPDQHLNLFSGERLYLKVELLREV